jgi:hypothetical protein
LKIEVKRKIDNHLGGNAGREPCFTHSLPIFVKTKKQKRFNAGKFVAASAGFISAERTPTGI